MKIRAINIRNNKIRAIEVHDVDVIIEVSNEEETIEKTISARVTLYKGRHGTMKKNIVFPSDVKISKKEETLATRTILSNLY